VYRAKTPPWSVPGWGTRTLYCLAPFCRRLRPDRATSAHQWKRKSIDNVITIGPKAKMG
jgi:hypothetical protein